jgi:predicted phosphodiesterase
MPKKKYAILGDIHSNLEALTAVIEHSQEQNVTQYACVGDIVGYNANPIECLDLIQELKCVCVRGNHDHYCSHQEDIESFHPTAAEVIIWTQKQLSEAHRTWLKHLWYRRTLGSITIVHATLDMPEKWGYVFDDLDAMPHFNYQLTSVCFHGHTHVPIVFEKSDRIRAKSCEKITIEQGTKYFINVGSVGQPRDGNPLASYATFDAETKEVEFHRVEYDIHAAQTKILEAGLPDWLAERLAMGK